MSKETMISKANDSRLVYEDLVSKLEIEKLYPTTFIVDADRQDEFMKSIYKGNPFPGIFRFVLSSIRKKALVRLFDDETVLQTPILAAILALCSNEATSIASYRGLNVEATKIYVDLPYAGAQAIRLFLADCKNKDFKKARLNSAIRVDNAWNGSFHKYKTLDGRGISFHCYYQSQQEKIVKALGFSKASKDFTFFSLRKDMKLIADVCSKKTALELENIAFSCGACASVIRTKKEWEALEVGQAVTKMPLFSITSRKAKAPNWGNCTNKGPLSGIKVLDLTHIIAGPACSRLLGEYGADVLLVRRGTLLNQEQAMLELDGWAAKRLIDLDLNEKEDLKRIKELIAEADVLTYSYQNGCFDKFGLSFEEIKKINPNIILSSLNCFSPTVWKEKPGWAPCAEDITGLSVSNGSLEEPKNLNGVPLDYIPGLFLALATLTSIKKRLETGESFDVSTSLCKGASYLHEATELCNKKGKPKLKIRIASKDEHCYFTNIRDYVETSIGKVGFPAEATFNTVLPPLKQNLKVEEEAKGFLK